MVSQTCGQAGYAAVAVSMREGARIAINSVKKYFNVKTSNTIEKNRNRDRFSSDVKQRIIMLKYFGFPWHKYACASPCYEYLFLYISVYIYIFPFANKPV